MIAQRILHAQLICRGYEDTVECKLAWEHVEELKKAARKKKERAPPKKELICEEDPLACREYDV